MHPLGVESMFIPSTRTETFTRESNAIDIAACTAQAGGRFVGGSSQNGVAADATMAATAHINNNNLLIIASMLLYFVDDTAGKR